MAVGYDLSSRTTRRRSALPGPRHLRGGPHRSPGPRHTPNPPVSHEPRIQELFDDLSRVGLHPFHSPNGIMLDEANPAFSACIRCITCDGFACLVHAKSDAEVVAVRPSLGHENLTLLRNAQVRRLETDAAGRTVTTVVAEVDGVEQRFSASVVVVRGRRELGEAAAGERRRQAPERLGQRFRPGGAQLHVPQQPSLPGGVQGEERHAVPEDTGPQRLVLSGTTTSSTRWATSRWSASPPPRCTGGRRRSPSSHRQFALGEVAEHAVDFWLSTEDLPDPDNRVTLTKDGTSSAATHPTTENPRAALPSGQAPPRSPRDAPPPPAPATST